jgi:hypothetical protein
MIPTFPFHICLYEATYYRTFYFPRALPGATDTLCLRHNSQIRHRFNFALFSEHQRLQPPHSTFLILHSAVRLFLVRLFICWFCSSETHHLLKFHRLSSAHFNFFTAFQFQ